ncbi:MAG: Gfo/Idh/MocA family protein [Kiritimatiellia bacterium]|jgi:predicted dehydrogenase
MKKPTTGHKTINVGIIGAGGIAVNHADGVKAHGGAQVVAVADSSAERCRAMADTYQIPKIYTDFRKLVADPEIDAVIVGLPNYLHLPVSLAALSAGKHVLLEKPIAMNYSEAQQIVNAARKHKRVLMPAMNMRFNKKVQTIKTLAQRGEFGEIYQVKAYWLRRSGCPRFGTWFGQKKLAGGGAILDIGVHALDAALYLLDNWRPLSVSSAVYSKFGPRGLGEGGWGKSDIGKHQFDVEDSGIAFIRLAGGVTLTLEACWAQHAEQSNKLGLELFGTEAGADGFAGKVFRYGKKPGEYEVVEPQDIPLRHPAASRQGHWLDVILGKDKPDVTMQQALVVQKILDAIYKSAKTRREVRLT